LVIIVTDPSFRPLKVIIVVVVDRKTEEVKMEAQTPLLPLIPFLHSFLPFILYQDSYLPSFLQKVIAIVGNLVLYQIMDSEFQLNIYCFEQVKVGRNQLLLGLY
jgi:hypothetical protein